MSEPRKLNTGDAQRAVYHAGDAPRTLHTAGAASAQNGDAAAQLEAARRRAREAAAESGRRSRQFNRVQAQDIEQYRAAQAARGSAPRTIRQPGTVQGGQGAQNGAPRTIRQPGAAQSGQSAQPASRAIHRTGTPAQAQPAAQAPQDPPLTMAQRQALALQRQAAAKQASAGARPSVRHLDLRSTQSERAAYNMEGDTEYEARQAARAAQGAQSAQASAAAASRSSSFGASGATAKAGGAKNGASAGGQPPKGPGKGKKGAAGDGGKKGGKKKKKGTWWKVLLGTLLVLALIFGGTFALIMHALRPETGGSITLSQLINTPKEYAGKEFNVLLIGIDRTGGSGGETNDGLTDMIMWMHFNNETGELKMLQIPRNTMVTTDASYSSNYQINGIAKTQGTGGANDLNALCVKVADMFQVSIDGYVCIQLEKLVELVDIVGGVECYIPETIDYSTVKGGGNSKLEQGYHILNGEQAEFFLRARKTYANSDLGRLNAQRYFYAAMFAKLRSMTVWDIAKNLPFYLSMVDTSMSISDLVSVAVSLMNVSSDKITLAQVPVYMGNIMYNGNDVVIVARQETADLLNTYYRENTGPVDAADLNILDTAVDISGRTPSDPNVQVMKQLDAEAAEGQAEAGLDDRGEFVYDTTSSSESTEGGEGTEGESSTDGAGSAESQDDAA